MMGELECGDVFLKYFLSAITLQALALKDMRSGML